MFYQKGKIDNLEGHEVYYVSVKSYSTGPRGQNEKDSFMAWNWPVSLPQWGPTTKANHAQITKTVFTASDSSISLFAQGCLAINTDAILLYQEKSNMTEMPSLKY